MDALRLNPIGVIRSPWKQVEGMPVQPCGAEGVTGTIELRDDLVEGLIDLEGFSHVWLIYALHQIREPRLRVKPFLDIVEHGIFATRSPARPNPLGLSLVRLLRIEGARLEIGNVDVLDGTPLLDIKPYVPAFDRAEDPRIGWFAGKADGAVDQRSDQRFK